MTNETYADKIAKLLRKAESTNSPHEAEALVEKAQELMIKYAIDEAMIARHAHKPTEQIIEEQIEYHSIYSRALYYIGRNIATHNDCKVLIRKGKNRMHTWCYVIGHESDVARVKVLNASLLVQAIGALNKFSSEYDFIGCYDEHDKFIVRRQFLMSFASGLNDKLERARQSGLQSAAVEHGSDSVALVVRDKSDKVQAWMEQAYPNTRSSRGGFKSGGREAAEAGRQAGRNANVGDPALGGSRKGLKA